MKPLSDKKKKMVYRLIPHAMRYADWITFTKKGKLSKDEADATWNKAYHGEMDRCAKEIGVRV